VSYRDGALPPVYTPFGRVARGMEIVDQIAAGGVSAGSPNGDGPPNLRLEILLLTLSYSRSDTLRS
jgi:peptidyl-prolyl cis-trans isomerase B (cyclophilin B)